jgi:23S rRNA (guanine745-N1)-methyltransferase
VNLLQPQDRKSAEPGDARRAVEARAALETAGVGDALVHAVADRLARVPMPPGAVILDLGCGTGHALGTLCAGSDRSGVGVDLSTAAITHAARSWPALTWVVANADRTVPMVDRSAHAVLSLHGRRNPPAVARVLRASGVLVVAVPAPEDLLELRTVVQGSGERHDRVPALIAEHEALFVLEERFRVADRRMLGRESLLALLGATYRGARHSAAAGVEALASLEVTLASDVCIFALRRDEHPRRR